jgi:F-type H+-transporting ATPase subunit b
MPAVSIDANLFWQIINFLILVVIFKNKFFKPMGEFLEKRKNLIKSEVDAAQTDKEAATKTRLEAEEALKAAKAESNKILVDAEKKAEERRDSILKEAHSLREKMIKSGEAEVEKMKDAARKELEKYARSMAADLAESIIASKTSAELIDEAIDKVGEGQ